MSNELIERVKKFSEAALPHILSDKRGAEASTLTDEILTTALYQIHDPLWIMCQTCARAFGGVTQGHAEVIASLENAFQERNTSDATSVLHAVESRTPAQWVALRELSQEAPPLLKTLARDHLQLACEYQSLQQDFAACLKRMGEPTDAGDDLVRQISSVWRAVVNAETTGPLQQEVPRSALTDLKRLIGLEPIKAEVEGIVNLITVNNMRAAHGLKTVATSNHLVFYGNPGTGKTTVARLIAELFRELGVLSSGHLVETQRSGLVAGYLGQTAIKVDDVIKQALGGVLFIDEAYSLKQRDDDSFGQEAIDSLLKLMEDHRQNLVVIVAGYTDEMKRFLGANPGFESRFNRYLNFPDYSAEELLLIFHELASGRGLTLSESAAQVAGELFHAAVERKTRTFGNGRFARNVFERCLVRQAGRIVASAAVNHQLLSTLEAADFDMARVAEWQEGATPALRVEPTAPV